MNVPSPQTAHPLALQLANHYRASKLSGPILEVAAGSGRNTRYFVGAGIQIVSTSDDQSTTQLPGGRDLYSAALSTHGYLHGTVAKLRAGLAELRRVLKPNGRIFITLGSIEDARYGLGIPVEETTFAPGDGDEAGVPHAYFDQAGVIEVLAPAFTVRSMGEVDADDIVGRWAHEAPQGLRHWFIEAQRT